MYSRCTSKRSVRTVQCESVSLIGLLVLSEKHIPFYLTTEHTEHTEINPSAVMSSFRVFGVFRGSPVFGDKNEYLVATPQYRVAVRIRTAGFWESYPRGPAPTW